MRLSEAMLLGSVTCKMEPANWNSCALGCAGNAVGIPQEDESTLVCPDGKDRFWHIYEVWPWLTADHGEKGASIWCKFDYQVCKGKMTFEQLVDYVRSIEPECGTCNKFDCSCVVSEAPPIAIEVTV